MSNLPLTSDKKDRQFLNGVEQTDEELKQYNYLNLGPTHPATHGIFQNVLKMDGEVIVEAEPTIGYIHRAFEKLAERRPFYQITPITDRSTAELVFARIDTSGTAARLVEGPRVALGAFPPVGRALFAASAGEMVHLITRGEEHEGVYVVVDLGAR